MEGRRKPNKGGRRAAGTRERPDASYPATRQYPEKLSTRGRAGAEKGTLSVSKEERMPWLKIAGCFRRTP